MGVGYNKNKIYFDFRTNHKKSLCYIYIKMHLCRKVQLFIILKHEVNSVNFLVLYTFKKDSIRNKFHS